MKRTNTPDPRWIAIFIALSPMLDAAPPAKPAPAEPTLFQFVVDPARELIDRTQRFIATAKDAVIERDPRFGACVRLGEAGIAVADNGTMRFDGGMTLEAWVRFDEPLPEKGAVLATKVGSFAFGLNRGRLNEPSGCLDCSMSSTI